MNISQAIPGHPRSMSGGLTLFSCWAMAVCWRWWDQFLKERGDGLLDDATRLPGNQPTSPEKVERLIALAMSPPPTNRVCWTLKSLADKVGNIALSTVHRILNCHGLKPNRVRTFKVSKDLRYELKVKEVVSLYVDPPDHAVVLSVDEKPGIQAMGRTPSPLTMKPGQATTRTHDYKRHGTTGLLAALDVATSKVTGRMVDRHRSEEFLSFLDQVAEGIKPGTLVHVVSDNVLSHKSTEVHKWCYFLQ